VAAAAIGAMAATGCAHCDTCDDFPAPCVGANCGGGGVAGGYPVAAPMEGAMMAAPTSMTVETMGAPMAMPTPEPVPMTTPSPFGGDPTPPPPMVPPPAQ
jgi:hypothetical protein